MGRGLGKRGKGLTLGEAVALFLSDARQPKTAIVAKQRVRALNSFVAFVGAGVPIEGVGSSYISKWKATLNVSESDWNFARPELFFCCLSGSCAGGDRSQPSRGFVVTRRKSKTVWSVASEADVQRVIGFEPSNPREVRMKAIAMLVLDGLRLSECQGLCIEDVYFDLGIVKVDRRTVALSPLTLAVLKNWIDARPQRGTSRLFLPEYPGAGRDACCVPTLLFDLKRLSKILGIEIRLMPCGGRGVPSGKVHDFVAHP